MGMIMNVEAVESHCADCGAAIVYYYFLGPPEPICQRCRQGRKELSAFLAMAPAGFVEFWHEVNMGSINVIQVD